MTRRDHGQLVMTDEVLPKGAARPSQVSVKRMSSVRDEGSSMAPLMSSRLPIGIRIAGSPDLAKPAAVEMAARAAEGLGYAAVWVLSDDPDELVAVATLAAAATERVRIGVGLLVDADGLRPRQREALIRLNELAPGRLTFGVAAAGIPADAAASVIDSVRAAAAPDVAAPRLVLSAASPETYDLLAREADGWLADAVPVGELHDRWATVQAAAARHGRAGALALVVPAWVELAAEDQPATRPDYQGSLDQVVADVLTAARAGAEEVVLMPGGGPTLDQALALAAQVAEALEAGADGSALDDWAGRSSG